MRRRLLVPLASLAFSAALFASPLLFGAEWPLDGKSIEIRLQEDASPSEIFAAEELQTYFRKMNGAEIGIQRGPSEEGKKTIIIGRHPENKTLWEDLDDPDRFIIDASPDQVRIVGGFKPPISDGNGRIHQHDWGILYGVYQFLEEQGVRWFRPEPEGEEVPKNSYLQIKEGKHLHQPSFSLRGWGSALYASSYLRSATDEETNMACLWALRNRSNVLRQFDPKLGGSLQFGGAGHAYDALIPKSLFESHPDYFPRIDGKRVPRGQRCLGNPALQDAFAEAVIRQAQSHPEWTMTSIDPNDGAGWCECEKCTALDDPAAKSGRGDGLSMASRVYAFNNIIAAKVAEACPGLRLYCLAYSQYTEAPSRVPKLADNLVVGLAPFAGAFSDYSRPLRDPKSIPNSRFLKNIDDYSRLGVKMYAREYLSYYAWPGPLPLLWTMQDRLSVYHDYGFIGAYNETHPTWGPQGMSQYMYLRLLWNPHMDLQAAIRDYCEKYYGPAAAPMLRYHEKLEARGKGGPYFGSGGSHAQNLFTPEFLAELKADVEEARKLAHNSPPYQWRTETVLAGYEFSRLYRKTAEAIQNGKIDQGKKALSELETFYCERYPKGDVFNKKEGRSVKKADGSYLLPAFLVSLKNDLVKADTMESRFEDSRILQHFHAGWKFQVDPNNDGVTRSWFSTSIDDAEWPRLKSGSPWQHQGFSSYTGTAWYRRTFPTPKVNRNKRVILIFDAVDGNCTVWINGKEIGRHDLIDPVDGHNRWDDSFFFDITDCLDPKKDNVLAVRVRKEDGNGGIHRNVKLISCSSSNPGDKSSKPALAR